jgi:uncharacterized membrane protein YeaQ/YmgE (transglycosylase-associated protein family)
MAALFFWVVLGGLVGGFAKSVLWYERSQGWLPCILFGAIGGIVGGYVRGFAGASDGFDLSSMGLIILGAAAVLSIYNLFAERVKATQTVSTRRAA